MCLSGCTSGNTAARWDIILNNTWLFCTKKPPGSHVHPRNINIPFLTKKNESRTEDNLQERRERRVHKRQAEQAVKSKRGQEALNAHTRAKPCVGTATETLWVSPSYQHWHWALCFHFSLNCILSLQGRFDHQLLFDTSTTCPAFISLHSRLKTQVRKSATWTAASPWLCKAHTCPWSEGGEEAGFPGTSGQPL